MIRDKVIEEVWWAKDRRGEKYQYDLEAMAKVLRAKEKAYGAEVLDLSTQRRPERVRTVR